MNRYIYIAAWASMMGAGIFALAAKADWSTWPGRLLAVSGFFAVIGNGLMHPPDISPARPESAKE